MAAWSVKIDLLQNYFPIRNVCLRRWQIILTGFSAESIWILYLKKLREPFNILSKLGPLLHFLLISAEQGTYRCRIASEIICHFVDFESTTPHQYVGNQDPLPRNGPGPVRRPQQLWCNL